MQSIQITTISVDEFQRLLKETAEAAAQSAIESFSKVKQDPNEEITVTQIAQLHGCSKQTVYRRIKEHKVPTVKLGRDVSVKRRWLETLKKPISTYK